jgi:hypothetical protein
MTTARKAVLIGVPECPDADARFQSLSDVVRNDLQLLEHALGQSGYSVDCFGIKGEPPTTSRIRGWIKKACADAPKGGTLLLDAPVAPAPAVGRQRYIVPPIPCHNGDQPLL